MKFQNKTIYDRHTLEKLNQTVNWTLTNKSKPINRILSMVIPLAILGSGFYIFQSNGPVPIAIGELILGAFLLLWTPFYHRFQAWMASKLMLKDAPEYTMDFEEDGYVVSSTTTHGEPTECTPYDTIWRLCETNGYFVLILNKHSGYILNKSGFVQGDADSFRDFIQEKTGAVFSVYPL